LVCCFFGFCCSHKDPDPQPYVDQFYRNEKKFSALMATLDTDAVTKQSMGKTRHWKRFSNRSKGQLQQLGITKVQVFVWEKGGQQIDFTTNWCPSHPVHLFYNSHGHSHTIIQQRYQKVSHAIRSLENHWTLWMEKKQRRRNDHR
jgi:hypothetical protein